MKKKDSSLTLRNTLLSASKKARIVLQEQPHTKALDFFIHQKYELVEAVLHEVGHMIQLNFDIAYSSTIQFEFWNLTARTANRLEIENVAATLHILEESKILSDRPGYVDYLVRSNDWNLRAGDATDRINEKYFSRDSWDFARWIKLKMCEIEALSEQDVKKRLFSNLK